MCLVVYFNLYDFDNDGKITERDLNHYFEYLKHKEVIDKQEIEEVIEDQYPDIQDENNIQKNKQPPVSQTEAQLGLISNFEDREIPENKNGEDAISQIRNKKEKKSKKLNINMIKSQNEEKDNNNDIQNPNVNNSNHTKINTKPENNKEDKSYKEETQQIINLIIKETASNNRDYIDYLDFRNQMLNTQFLLDYNMYITLQ